MAGSANSPLDALDQEFRAMLRSQSLESGGRFRFLHLPNNVSPVAYFVSAKHGDGQLVLPLNPGLTLVGRASVANYVTERSLLSGVIEGAQWRVTWTPSKVSISDAGSTNGSVLIQRANRERTAYTLNELQKDPDSFNLGWDGSKQNDAAHELADGDLIVNAYGPFVYIEDAGKLPAGAVKFR